MVIWFSFRWWWIVHFKTIVIFKRLDVSLNGGTPKSSILIGVFHYKPSILGYHHLRKHPFLHLLVSGDWSVTEKNSTGGGGLPQPVTWSSWEDQGTSWWFLGLVADKLDSQYPMYIQQLSGNCALQRDPENQSNRKPVGWNGGFISFPNTWAWLMTEYQFILWSNERPCWMWWSWNLFLLTYSNWPWLASRHEASFIEVVKPPGCVKFSWVSWVICWNYSHLLRILLFFFLGSKVLLHGHA